MPCDLNEGRRIFAERLANDPRRFSMDIALAHVIAWAFQKGIDEERSNPSTPLPTGNTSCEP